MGKCPSSIPHRDFDFPGARICMHNRLLCDDVSIDYRIWWSFLAHGGQAVVGDETEAFSWSVANKT